MIRFIDVYKEYDNGTKALKGVSMRIDDGEFVFLVGPSGSGKSTIIKLITGEIATTEGRLMVNGYNKNNIRPGQVPYMRRTLGIIFQDFRLIEKKTVYENLSFAMRAIGTSTRELRRRSSRVEVPMARMAKDRFSYTVFFSMSRKSWKMMPSVRRM